MVGRSSSTPNYRYGFNGKEKDDEVKGSANSLDFGDRIYDSRLGRWNSPDGKLSKYPGWSPYHFGYCSPIITIDPNGKENIIVIGSDNGRRKDKDGSIITKSEEGAKYREHFVLNGAVQYKNYQEAKPDEKATVLLFSTGNAKEDQRLISLAVKNGVNGADITIVENSTEITSKIADRGRQEATLVNDPVLGVGVPVGVTEYQEKVTNLTFVGHGTFSTFYLDNAYVGDNRMTTINKSDFGGLIQSNDFSQNAQINFISCRGYGQQNLAAPEANLLSNVAVSLNDGGNNISVWGAQSGTDCYYQSADRCVFQSGASTVAPNGQETENNQENTDANTPPVSRDNPRE